MPDRRVDLASLVGLSEEQLELALRSGAVALWEIDIDQGTSWQTPNHPGLFGLDAPPPFWSADRFLELVEPDDRDRVAAIFAEAERSAATFDFECAIRDARGQRRWLKAAGRLVRAADGRVIRAFGSVHDITARKLAQDALRRSMPRLGFLAELAGSLGRQATFDATVGAFAREAVGDFCDACVVDVAVGASRRRAGVAHRIAAKEPALAALFERFPPGPREDTPVAQAVKRREPVHIAAVDDAWLRMVAAERGPGYLEAIRELGLRSVIIVPFQLAEDLGGAASYFVTEDDRRFDAADVRFAEELTRRGAQAFERAHLHARTEEALRARDSLISTSSHELMTPLTTMRLLVDSMKRSLAAEADIPRPKVERMIDVTDRAIRRLQRLVGDMLDVSRLNAGKLSLQLAPMDLSDAVGEAVERLHDRLEAELASVSVRLVRPLRGSWDRDRVDQIVTNLLINALRYAPHSALVVGTAVVDGMAEVTVADTGPGIARADHDRIFQRFERVLLSGDGTGLGLGLFIARQLAERHGGKLWVESDLGAGARFVLRLPLSA